MWRALNQINKLHVQAHTDVHQGCGRRKCDILTRVVRSTCKDWLSTNQQMPQNPAFAHNTIPNKFLNLNPSSRSTDLGRVKKCNEQQMKGKYPIWIAIKAWKLTFQSTFTHFWWLRSYFCTLSIGWVAMKWLLSNLSPARILESLHLYLLKLHGFPIHLITWYCL